MKIKTLLISILLIAGIGGTYAQSFGVPYGAGECIADDLDGTLTIRAYGVGKNRSTSKEQAMKNAVYNVIFKGVPVQNNAYLSRPLLFEANAEEKYNGFFTDFFSENGAWKQFADLHDKRLGSTSSSRRRVQASTDVTVRVHRDKLRSYLEQNNIIKNEDDW